MIAGERARALQGELGCGLECLAVWRLADQSVF
jgi:hypothetical protein